MLVLLPGMDGTGELFQPFLSCLPVSERTLIIRYPSATEMSYDELEAYVLDHLPNQPFTLIAESFLGPDCLAADAEKGA